MGPFSKNFDFNLKEGIIKKISYERRTIGVGRRKEPIDLRLCPKKMTEKKKNSGGNGLSALQKKYIYYIANWEDCLFDLII